MQNSTLNLENAPAASVIAAVQQLQQAITQFAEEAGSSQEHMTALVKNTDTNRQPERNAVWAQSADTGAISSSAGALAQQLQRAISRFADEIGEHHEGVNARIKSFGDQQQQGAPGLKEFRGELREEIRRLESWILNNRR